MALFAPQIYRQRRQRLAERLDRGVVLLLGHEESPMNYADNHYPFVQDGTFLYCFGHAVAGLAGVIDLDAGTSTLFGYDPTLDDIVWTGPSPSLEARGEAVGADSVRPIGDLAEVIAEARAAGREIQVVPPYRAEVRTRLAELGVTPGELEAPGSERLTRAVIALRSVKSEEELAEIESALELSWDMHTRAMRMARDGVVEQQVVGAVLGAVAAGGGRTSFPVILSRRGETLHNHHYGNTLRTGDLVLHDSGAVSAGGYASDITRTFPVGRSYSSRQRDVYETVLAAQLAAIAAMAPGLTYESIHLLACRTLVTGLVDLGLMRGDVEEAVAVGAHALFMPHGLGHMMGIDVHDMEGLGEDRVGYDEEVRRSSQFGRSALRFGRRLEPGFVLTVEPGIYFIPDLVAGWRADRRHEAFLDYDAIAGYLDFGGIRIEDDVVVTESGVRVLGRPIPKTVAEVEALTEA